MRKKTGGLTDLIEALTIFKKYGDPSRPTHCEHDELAVVVDPADVCEEDTVRLEELGFFPAGGDHFKSFRFGSA
jgi:hypothetical protein